MVVGVVVVVMVVVVEEMISPQERGATRYLSEYHVQPCGE